MLHLINFSAMFRLIEDRHKCHATEISLNQQLLCRTLATKSSFETVGARSVHLTYFRATFALVSRPYGERASYSSRGRPLTASVINQPPWRADLIVRAGSYLLFGGNRCCKFSSTGAQNYAMPSQTQVNTKLKFSTRYAFSKFQTQTVNKPFTYNNILRLDDCHHTFSLIPLDYFRNRWRTETEWVSCIH